MITTRILPAKHVLFSSLLFLVLGLSAGCSESAQFPSELPGGSNDSSSLEDIPAITPPPSVSPTPDDSPTSYKMEALAWESSKYPERKEWSKYLQSIILNEWNSLLPGANDITAFCPRYNNLQNEERANVWAQIFVAMAKYESAYSPTSRMHETTMGTDPVTKQPVYSEGLLQLSYQDVSWAPWCEFDWSKDKSLAAASPNKTILSPYKNLHCGVGILASQVKKKGSIILNTGVYWAVIKSGGKYQQISSIQSMVKSLSLCK